MILIKATSRQEFLFFVFHAKHVRWYFYVLKKTGAKSLLKRTQCQADRINKLYLKPTPNPIFNLLFLGPVMIM
jgi:hypothetical protein